MSNLTNQTHLTGLTVNYPRLAVTSGVLLLLVGAVVYLHSIAVLSKAVYGWRLLNATQHKTSTQWSRSEVGAPLEPH